jgi:hypothetical protein
MMCVVPDRARWVRDHPLELAIVLLTPSFLPASLQAARAFRLLRLPLLMLATLTRRLLSTEGIRDAGVLAAMTSSAAARRSRRRSGRGGVRVSGFQRRASANRARPATASRARSRSNRCRKVVSWLAARKA